MIELSLKQLHEIVGGRLRHDAVAAPEGVSLRRVCTDSRQVNSGDVFWGLVGPNHDGADFADEALRRGAAGVVVQQRDVEPRSGRFSLRVNDTTEALWKLARWNRGQFRGRLIALAGSGGKTTTREMIHTVLGSTLRGTASPQNFNNHIGVPLSLLGIDANDQYAVIELGANALGEIAALAELARPDTGVITHLGDAHLEGFKDRRSIGRAKAELLSALPPGGLAVLNGDDALLRCVAADCTTGIRWVGRDRRCDLVATEVCCRDGWLSFIAESTLFRLPVWGRHQVISALLAIEVSRQMGISMPQIAEALEGFRTPPMRCEVVREGNLTIINDTYNSSPMAMRAALELLRDIPASGGRIVVCGDMAEQGQYAERAHREIGAEVVTRCGADWLIACGEHAEQVKQGAIAAGMPDRRAVACRFTEETLPQLEHAISPGAVVLVKGA
ncbi:MAG: UDP-N-acetylmuramoyl-tripeptide--D-alanyl-D-alanine ligase, partial [Planctomycetes bacterium]|nr:UDP-N-acetylmuramoyl-tripeptide--D-alanyl-D-alanine ligase [Planctomycetota bacterium]